MIVDYTLKLVFVVLRSGKKKWKQMNKPSVAPYQMEGMAKANILLFSGWTGGITSEIEKLGDASYPRILALKSTMPIGVAGDADEAGDVVFE
jgi:hypothetical protein